MIWIWGLVILSTAPFCSCPFTDIEREEEEEKGMEKKQDDMHSYKRPMPSQKTTRTKKFNDLFPCSYPQSKPPRYEIPNKSV